MNRIEKFAQVRKFEKARGELKQELERIVKRGQRCMQLPEFAEYRANVEKEQKALMLKLAELEPVDFSEYGVKVYAMLKQFKVINSIIKNVEVDVSKEAYVK